MKISDLKIAIARKKLLALADASPAALANCKMGILLEAEAEMYLKPFLQLKQDLKLEQQDFKVVICRERAVKNNNFEYPVISLKDFGWKGDLKEASSVFLDTDYDVLISFTSEENKMADFLVSVTRARLKVGRKMGGENGIFDLNISAALSSPEVFTEELKKYLRILKTTA